MLEAKDLACERSGRRVFGGIAFRVDAGLAAITGPNGSGKSSLLRVLAGLLPFERGELRWDGVPLAAAREAYLGQLAYLGHSDGIKGELTCDEHLDFSTRLAGHRAARGERAGALARLGLASRASVPAAALSQGQRRRLALAGLLLRRARLWILDEPYAALDDGGGALLDGIVAVHLTRPGAIAVVTRHEGGRLPRAPALELRLAGA